jgi:hypothetical protein
MKVRILIVLLAAALALVPCVTALAADEEDSATVEHQPRWVGVGISPDSWDIENVEAESSYTESFALANTGGVGGAPLDVYVAGDAATNGENTWALSGGGQPSESTYGIQYSISDEESEGALTPDLAALTEGLSGACSQDISLELLTPTAGVDEGESVSTSIDLYAVKNPESQSLCGERQDEIPSGEFAQYPSEISIEDASAGNPVVFENFYLRNDAAEEKTFYLSAWVAPDTLLSEGYERIPSPNWTRFFLDDTVVNSVTVAANDTVKLQVQISIPENEDLNGQQWECWIVTTTTDPEQEEQPEGINFNTYVCSRLLVTAAGGSDGSGGVGAATIIGAVCGSALLVGFLGWRIRRRNSGSVIDSGGVDGDVDSDVDSDDDTSAAVSGYTGSIYTSSVDDDLSALADDPEE